MHSKPLKKYVILLHLFLIMAGAADVAHAAPPSCSFVSGISNGAISFSNIDPSTTPGPLYGNVIQQVSFTCNKSGIAYTISVTPSSGWTLQSGPNAMAYTLGVAASGAYTGTAVNLLIPSGAGASSSNQSAYQNAPAGTYTNSAAITITVSFGGPLSPITATAPIANVSGIVINTCAVSQSAGTLTFNMDPAVSGATMGSIPQDLKIKCTKQDSIAITGSSKCGGATPKLADPATCLGFSIPYTFTFLSSAVGAGFGSGNDIALGLGGSVNSTDYENAPVGSYGDTETITINY